MVLTIKSARVHWILSVVSLNTCSAHVVGYTKKVSEISLILLDWQHALDPGVMFYQGKYEGKEKQRKYLLCV